MNDLYYSKYCINTHTGEGCRRWEDELLTMGQDEWKYSRIEISTVDTDSITIYICKTLT